MRKPTEDELKLIADEAPEFLEMVTYAKKKKVKDIIFCIDAFEADDDALLLHRVLWYATSEGLLVHVTGVSE